MLDLFWVYVALYVRSIDIGCLTMRTCMHVCGRVFVCEHEVAQEEGKGSARRRRAQKWRGRREGMGAERSRGCGEETGKRFREDLIDDGKVKESRGWGAP